MRTLKLKDDIYWVGVLDPNLKVFDVIVETEFGTSYNAYVVKGSEKTAIFETAKENFLDEYIEKLEEVTPISEIDYLVVNHTEPDHAGSVKYLLEKNPNITIVGSRSAINFMREIVNLEFKNVVVKDEDVISLGNKTLRFISAPNLHWPDTMFTYVEEDRILISCDAFGCHYCLDTVLFSTLKNFKDYEYSLKFYFDHIMSPFKSFVRKAVEKIRDLDIGMICTGHGPVIDKNPRLIIDKYNAMAQETNPNQNKTVIIPYVSAYGYTKILAEEIEKGVKAAGDIEVRKFDLEDADHSLIASVAAEWYWADGVLLGSPTILGEALKPIWDLTTAVFASTHGNKIASAFGSYGWTGEAVPNIIMRLGQLKMKIYGEGYRVKFKPSEEQLKSAFEFGKNFGKCVLEGKIVD